MRDREPTVRARELGESIRQAMRKADLKSGQVARQLGWSHSRVSRLLSGKRGGSIFDVVAVLAVCGVHGVEREHLIDLANQHERPNWLQLPKQLRTLINHENQAIRISQFEFNLIPGLLQTEGYARALITEASSLPHDEIDKRVTARLRRQKLLSSEHPPMITFYVHEFALRLPVGGQAIMSEQLHKLLRLSVRPHLVLRLVPAAIGAHAAIHGSFRLMEFDQINPVTYIETETSSIFLETAEEIAAYRSILARLKDSALDEGQSREVIAALAVELYPDGEDHEALERPPVAEEQLQRRQW
jgi:predicted XRE-type DNA-binding protein